DNMADAVAGFKLDATKQQDALVAMEDYVVAQGKARGQLRDGDRDAIRTAMQEAREKLSASMKKLLSEEQFKKFESTMQGGFGGRGGGGGRGPGGGGGG